MPVDHLGDSSRRWNVSAQRTHKARFIRPGRGLTTFTAAVTAALAITMAGCSSSNPGRPAGLQRAGALDTGCTLTYADGVADGATIQLYNPGSGPVVVRQLGIEEISNGVLETTVTVPDPNLPFTVAAGTEVPVSVTFGGASSATSCKAGWNG
jgi:hypothetical protein